MSPEIQDADGTEKPPKRRFGCLFYATGFLLVFGIALTLFFRLWYSKAAQELKVEKDRIVARGEPLWFSDLAPGPVDPEDDAAPLFFAALEKFKQPSQAFHAFFTTDPPAPQTPAKIGRASCRERVYVLV